MSPIMIEVAALAAIVSLNLVSTALVARAEPDRGQRRRVFAGGALTGLLVGAIGAFVMLPQLFSLTEMKPIGMDQIMTLKAQAVLLPGFIGLQLVQQGALARVPGLSKVLRPYRRAVLMRRKTALDRQLAKLTPAYA